MTYYPFNGIGQQTILYDNGCFAVASGYDKRDKRNKNAATFLSIGLIWLENKKEGCKAYPIGEDDKPQWFRVCDELAPSFLGSLLGKQPENDGKIVEAINNLIEQQNSQARGAR